MAVHKPKAKKKQATARQAKDARKVMTIVVAATALLILLLYFAFRNS